MADEAVDAKIPGANPEVEKPSTDDPKVFMDIFFTSTEYLEAYNKFFQDKTLSHNVSEDEKRDVFNDREEAKFAMIDFAKGTLGFVYDSTKFPIPSANGLNTYIASAEDLAKIHNTRATSEEILSLDELRSIYHNAAARVLVTDKIVPTEKLGRSLARLILIDKKLDTFEGARVKDIDQIYKKFGVR